MSHCKMWIYCLYESANSCYRRDARIVIKKPAVRNAWSAFFVISSGVEMTGEGFRSGNEKFICILFA